MILHMVMWIMKIIIFVQTLKISFVEHTRLSNKNINKVKKKQNNFTTKGPQLGERN